MALIKEQTANGFAGLPALRQLGLMIGLAASVAMGVAVVLWSQEPGYSLLYGNLSGNDTSQVLDALTKSNIPYKVDESSGAVMVPTDKVHDARVKLAGSGLPKGNGVGFELFEKEQDLGTSQFVEQARYQYALEVELSRSIMTMRDIKNVRVHLAIPKRTAFVRKKEMPRASVVLELFGGRSLDDGQVSSVVHLVTAAVNGMSPESVTVVDQTGNLLSKGMRDKGMAMTSSQFEYTRRLEQTYNQRIEDLISPIVGPGRVRAQVVADVDFTMSEKTLESFNPDLPALRSEQLDEQSSASGGAGAGGIPGALSNQPPAGGTTNGAAGTQASGGAGGSNSRRTTRNYELDKTISHTRKSAGDIRKISVAVLVDDLQNVDEDGVVTKTPLDDAAIARITSLVKESVGFDARRGDSINVINASFHVPAPPEPLPEIPITEQQWVWDLGKQVLGGLVVLILVFGVLKPVMRSLAEKGEGMPVYADQMSPDQLSLQGGAPGGQLAAPTEDNLTMAKNLAAQDPARVAQVVKTWVDTD